MSTTRTRSRAKREPSPTPADRLARTRRALDLATGQVSIPLTCPECEGRKLDGSSFSREVWCLGCGRETTEKKVHAHRRQSVRRYIVAGEIRYRAN